MACKREIIISNVSLLVILSKKVVSKRLTQGGTFVAFVHQTISLLSTLHLSHASMASRLLDVRWYYPPSSSDVVAFLP